MAPCFLTAQPPTSVSIWKTEWKCLVAKHHIDRHNGRIDDVCCIPNLESMQYSYSIAYSVVLVKTLTLTLRNSLACILLLLLLLKAERDCVVCCRADAGCCGASPRRRQQDQTPGHGGGGLQAGPAQLWGELCEYTAFCPILASIQCVIYP